MGPSHSKNEGSESESSVSINYRQEESLTSPPLNSRSVKGVKTKPQAVGQRQICSGKVAKYLTKWSIEYKMGEHSDVENILTWFKFALRRPWSNTSLVVDVMKSYHLREALEIWPFIAATCGGPSEASPMQDPYHQYKTVVSAFLGTCYAQTSPHRYTAAISTVCLYISNVI